MEYHSILDFAISADTMGIIRTSTEEEQEVVVKRTFSKISEVFRLSPYVFYGVCVPTESGFSFVDTTRFTKNLNAMFFSFMETQRIFLLDDFGCPEKEEWEGLLKDPVEPISFISKNDQKKRELGGPLFWASKMLDSERSIEDVFVKESWEPYGVFPAKPLNQISSIKQKLPIYDLLWSWNNAENPFERENIQAKLIQSIQKTPAFRMFFDVLSAYQFWESTAYYPKMENAYETVKTAMLQWFYGKGPGAKAIKIDCYPDFGSMTQFLTKADVDKAFVSSYGVYCCSENIFIPWKEVFQIKAGNKIMWRQTK